MNPENPEPRGHPHDSQLALTRAIDNACLRPALLLERRAHDDHDCLHHLQLLERRARDDHD